MELRRLSISALPAKLCIAAKARKQSDF